MGLITIKWCFVFLVNLNEIVISDVFQMSQTKGGVQPRDARLFFCHLPEKLCESEENLIGWALDFKVPTHLDPLMIISR